MEEALEALQSEREQKYAVKKELDKRINSESILNLSSFAGFAGLKFGSKKSNISSNKTISISPLPQICGHNFLRAESQTQLKAISFASSSNCIPSEKHSKPIKSVPIKKFVLNQSVKENISLEQKCRKEDSIVVVTCAQKFDQNSNLLSSKQEISQALKKDFSDSVTSNDSCDNGCYAFCRMLLTFIISCFTGCIAP